MLFSENVEASRRVSEASGRLQKIQHLADLLRRVEPELIEAAVALLSGEPRQGRFGLGPATVRNAVPAGAARKPALTLAEVDAALDHIARMKKAGSPKERARMLRELLVRATPEEQDFLVRAVLGELRQGALEGLMADAIARAADLPASDIRRALMVSGDLGTVARAALTEGRAGLARLGVQLFQPLKPMLAQTADDTADALALLGTAAFEFKLDGARIQVHKADDTVRVYSRALNEVTDAVPEVVEAVRAIGARTLILDGETIALQADGRPQPFQITMRRFGRRLDVESLRKSLPLRAFFFDCLYLNDESILDRPFSERVAEMATVLPESLLIPREVIDDAKKAEAFFQRSLDAGHEGLMAKDPAAPYQAGGRGAAWLKIKPAVTLDLVVLAVEWGHGRRCGYLSNLHLGARDPQTGGFVMLGKTFKGMTDEMLRWQTEELKKLMVSQTDNVVHVKPSLVVEIAFNDIQASPHYPGGLALRFARVKRYRPDKKPEDADTIDTVREIYRRRVSDVTDIPPAED
jgi:DNA ligase-1